MENIKAKKKYGQNFLKDSTVLDKIIQSMPTNNNYVVEIGPGLGDLTKNIVKYKDMTAYEVDTDLIGILESKFAIEIESKKLKLIHTDVLEAWDRTGTLSKIVVIPFWTITDRYLNFKHTLIINN